MSLFKILQGQGQTAAEDQADGTGARHVNAQEFKGLLAEAQVPVVVDFWAEWCGPCHMMAPSVDQLAREFGDRAVVAKLDADEYPEILAHYGIIGIPTLIYFKGGEEKERVVGVTPYNALKAKLEKLA